MRGRLNKPDFKKEDRPERSEGAPRRPFGNDRPYNQDRGERPARRFEGGSEERPRRSFGDERGERFGSFGNRSSFGSRPGAGKFGGESRPYNQDRGERPARRFEGGEDNRAPRGSRGPSNGEGREFGNKPFGRRFEGGEQRPEGGQARPFGNDRPYNQDRGERPARRFEGGSEERPRRSFGDERPPRPAFGADKRFERGDRDSRPARDDRGRQPERFGREERPSFGRKPYRDTFASKPGLKKGSRDTRFGQNQEQSEAPSYKNLQYYEEDKTRGNKRRREEPETDGSVRLNRYIANAGICSRREADVLIESGEIRVNGEVVTELGYKVQPSDTVHYGKTNLKREKQVYVLLNKPKDFLTTTEDPEGRKTVMDLVANASKERIFPVGRLDRNTTGLLLFTNDGEVAQKLSHPSHRNKKVYQVELDKDLTEEHLAQIAAGLELEDGKAEVDDVAVVAGNPKFVGVEIHIGRNRIVRRIFEHLGYEVKTLDRVQYAGLTKKDLPRGNWRYLTEKEVIRLKYFM
ncbi:pseudouridine synthase [Hymenobacter coalescens]